MAFNQRFLRPAAAIRLLLRLEDFTPQDQDEEVASESDPFEQQIKILEAARKKVQTRLAAARVAKSAPDIHKEQATVNKLTHEIENKKKQAAKSSGVPLQTGDVYSIEVVTYPIEANYELNTYKSCDTADFSIPFRDAPFPSMIIRSGIVELYMGSVDSSQYDTANGARLPLDKSTIIYRGVIDEWETQHDEDDAKVNVTSRSLEAILYDTKVNPESSLYKVHGKEEKISAYVNRVLANIPATGGRIGGDQLKAVYYRADGVEPSLSRASLSKALQSAASQKAAQGPQTKPTIQPDLDPDDDGLAAGFGQPRVAPVLEDMRAWDLIVQACSLCGGLIASYDPAITLEGVTGDFILIRPPQTVYESVDGLRVRGGAPDNFSRLLPDPKSPLTQKTSEVRFFVWGDRIKSFKTQRKLGRMKVPAVEINSYNPDAPPGQRILVVRYPAGSKKATNKKTHTITIAKGDKRATSMGAKGDGKSETVHVKYVFGIRDKAQLEQAAVALFHAIGRNELSVTIETDDMLSYADPNDTSINANSLRNDILGVRFGTPIKLMVAREIKQGTASGATAVTTTPLTELFERRGPELEKALLSQRERFDPNQDPEVRKTVVHGMVQRLSKALDGSRPNDLFYTRTVKGSYSAEEGWSATFELVNFIEIRNASENLSTASQQMDQARKLKNTGKAKTKSQVAIVRALGSQGKR